MNRGVQIALACLVGLLPVFSRIAADPGSASAVLLHGSTGISILIAAIVAVIMGVARPQPVSDGGAEPAKVPPPGGKVLAYFSVGFAVALTTFFLWQYRDYRETLDVQQHGRRAIADVSRIYTDGCGRSGCTTAVEYRFVPNGLRPGSSSTTGYGVLATGSRYDDQRLLYAQRYRRVPIVYDAEDPKISRLNFNDRALHDDAGANLRFMMLFGIMIAMVAGCFAMILARPAPVRTAAA